MARFYSFLIFTIFALFALSQASQWFAGTDKVYDAWHETELEKWLDDHDIPYPKPSDRKDLVDTVTKHWIKTAQAVYKTWDEARLKTWLTERKIDFSPKAKKSSLTDVVKAHWYDTKASAEATWESAKDWIFDSWSESQLRGFLDKHNIPHYEPRTRDTLLSRARESFDSIRKNVGDTAAAPGNWLFDVWSDSELKAWADERGIPVPQGSKRNELIALVRRNMRRAKFQGHNAFSTASSIVSSATSNAKPHASSLGAQAADYTQLKKNELFEDAVGIWSNTRLKVFLDERNVPIPQGSKRNELLALVRRNAHEAKKQAGFSESVFESWSSPQLEDWLKTLGSKAKGSRNDMISRAKKQHSSVSSKGGKEYASATAAAARATGYLFESWSDSDLKSFLDSYGVSVPQSSKRDEVIATARRHSRYFTQGPSWFSSNGVLGQLYEGWQWAKEQLVGASGAAYKKSEAVAHYAKDEATSIKQWAQEAGQRATDKAKMDL